MRMTLTIVQMLVRITGVLQLILGLLIWAENMLNLISIHTLIGLIFVVALWVLAVLSTRAGVPIGLGAGVVILGLIALVFGMIQVSLLPGSAHWVIQVVHLLIGMAAVASGEIIGGRVRRRQLAITSVSAHP
jgi:hypothetical protein